MNLFSIVKGFFQLIVLLAQLSPEMVRLWRSWEEKNGKTLSGAERRRLTETVKEAVKTRDTTDLEAFLTKRG